MGALGLFCLNRNELSKAGHFSLKLFHPEIQPKLQLTRTVVIQQITIKQPVKTVIVSLAANFWQLLTLFFQSTTESDTRCMWELKSVLKIRLEPNELLWGTTLATAPHRVSGHWQCYCNLAEKQINRLKAGPRRPQCDWLAASQTAPVAVKPSRHILMKEYSSLEHKTHFVSFTLRVNKGSFYPEVNLR